MSVLVTDADQKHTLGIVRCLGEDGYNVGVISSKKKSLSSFSKYCKKEHIIKESSKNYIDELIKIYKKFNYKVLLPVGSISNFNIVKNKQRLIDNKISYLLPSQKSFNIAFSKELTTKLANKLKILTPKTWIINDINDVLKFKYNFKNKLVIKARKEMGVNIVYYVSTKSQLINTYKKICKKHNFIHSADLPIIQEYIDGDGQGFFGIYKNGNCKTTFQHKRLREYPVSGGMSVCSISQYSDSIEKKGRLILDELKWNGVAMVEFKVNKNGEPYLLEINPKFWGSIELAIFSGSRFPTDYVKIITNSKLKLSNKYKLNTKYQWPLHGDFQTAFYSLYRFNSFISDLFSVKVGNNIFSTRDISGSLGIFYNLFQKFLKLR